MSILHRFIQHSRLAVLVVLCLAALTATSVFAGGVASPLRATDILGSPDAAVNGKLAVGSSSVGNKSLTVSGVIDFVGAGTVHNYFSQGGGNNMQINTNVDEANTVGDASKSQWKLVLGSSLDQFSIRRSPAGSTYDEDALLFMEGTTGNVGIATVDTGNGGAIPFTFQAKLHVVADAGDGIRGESGWSSMASGVYGWSGEPDGNGVIGREASTTGDTWGVGGIVDSTAGTGVYGWAKSTTGVNYGVVGVSESTDGVGTYGWVDSTNGFTIGVYGESDSSTGVGVYGYGTGTTDTNYGVIGLSDSTAGDGVFGWASTSTGTGTGVFGESDSTDGAGVFGLGYASSGTNFGVYGATYSPDGYAGYFAGDVHVNGTLSKSAGSFKIDDPLDPTHKYLQHSFVESPDMMNIYNGNVILDDNGEAWVDMPDWFQALNMDFRYQLTPIDTFAPLYVAQKIQDNRFKIAGGESGMEVSWQVTGIRHDPYAEANRIQVLVNKPASEQGTYLFPQLYAQPESKGLDQALGLLSNGSSALEPPQAPAQKPLD
jgi:hypothetical protein